MGSRNKPGCCACAESTGGAVAECDLCSTVGTPTTFKVVLGGWAATTGTTDCATCTNINGTYTGIAANTALDCTWQHDFTDGQVPCLPSTDTIEDQYIRLVLGNSSSGAPRVNCTVRFDRADVFAGPTVIQFRNIYGSSETPVDCTSILNTTLSKWSAVCNSSDESDCGCDTSSLTCVVSAETT